MVDVVQRRFIHVKRNARDRGNSSVQVSNQYTIVEPTKLFEIAGGLVIPPQFSISRSSSPYTDPSPIVMRLCRVQLVIWVLITSNLCRLQGELEGSCFVASLLSISVLFFLRILSSIAWCFKPLVLSLGNSLPSMALQYRLGGPIFWIIIGDFNMILTSEDKLGTEQQWGQC